MVRGGEGKASGPICLGEPPSSFQGYELRFEVAAGGDDANIVLSVTSLPSSPSQPLTVSVTGGSPPTWLPRTCSAAGAGPAGPALVGACAGFPDVSVWPSEDDAPAAVWTSEGFTLPIPSVVGASVAWSTGASPRARADILSTVAAARATLVSGYLSRTGPALNETLAGMGAVFAWTATFGPHQGIVAPITRGNFWGMVRAESGACAAPPEPLSFATEPRRERTLPVGPRPRVVARSGAPAALGCAREPHPRHQDAD